MRFGVVAESKSGEINGAVQGERHLAEFRSGGGKDAFRSSDRRFGVTDHAYELTARRKTVGAYKGRKFPLLIRNIDQELAGDTTESRAQQRCRLRDGIGDERADLRGRAPRPAQAKSAGPRSGAELQCKRRVRFAQIADQVRSRDAETGGIPRNNGRQVAPDGKDERNRRWRRRRHGCFSLAAPSRNRVEISESEWKIDLAPVGCRIERGQPSTIGAYGQGPIEQSGG